MTFDESLDQYRRRFSRKGSFTLSKEEQVGKRIREENVPNEPGIYLIYALRSGVISELLELLYIGKAGTLRQNGTFREQKLSGRLKAPRKGTAGQRYFQEQISVLGLSALVFQWFVTFTKDTRVIPAKAEADLLQAYFEEHGQLPQWNTSF